MKPNDHNGRLPLAERPFRVLVLSGSDRRQYNCPGVDSKSRMLMLRMAQRLPQEWEIDLEDLGNEYGRARIQSCNGCVSTSMALCCWPCNCYEPDRVDRFSKGKVEPGRYRAYGYRVPGHRWADLKLKWREVRIRAGAPPADSSPAEQQKRGLSRDDIGGTFVRE